MNKQQVETLVTELTPLFQEALRQACAAGGMPMVAIDAGDNQVLVWLGPRAQIQEFKGGYERAMAKIGLKAGRP